MSPAKAAPKSKSTRKSTASKKSAVFTAEERAAMKDYIKEKKAGKANDESAVLAKIAELPEPDRSMAKRVHAIVMSAVPDLTPRLWYGMPAYARDGNVVCYFQDAHKFKARYATLGFSDKAHLDEGALWPVAYALKELTPAEEAKISELVKKAAS